MTKDLSVIVIARNEERRIGDALDACLRAVKRSQDEGLIATAEVILSDSASTDRTIEIAQNRPVTILLLDASWPLSAAAGRFVGLRHATGRLVLFVDGDYVLFEDWLPAAIRALEADPHIAGICGRDVEEFTGDSILMRRAKVMIEALVGEPEAIPVGLYRREALDAVGGIHPFLRGAEDRDLAHRLRSAGFRLPRMPIDMGRHRWSDSGALDYVTYFRSVLAWSIGDGQVFRLRRSVPLVRAQARQRYASARHLINYLIGIGLLILVLAATAATMSPLLRPLVLLALGGILLVILLARSRRWSWKELGYQLHAIPYSMIRHAGFAIGFLQKPPPVETYPKGERVLLGSRTGGLGK